VDSVYYEAFVPLAESFLNQICNEALEKFGVTDARIYLAHSEGDIRPGQTSLIVITATAHRAEAFLVTQHVIDELKKRVPIWKHERYSDGSSAWLRGCALHGSPG
jgi:molybdopterin synthase catalytic subunit